MATYFHGGSEIQADNLQTLYLVNPGYAAYSDIQAPPPNMLHALAPVSLHQTPPQPPGQHLVGIPLASQGPAGSGDDPGRPSLHGIPALHGAVHPRAQYGLWSSKAGGDGPQHQILTAVSGGGGAALSAHPHRRQGLSLSLNDSSAVGVSPGDGSNTSSAAAAKGVSGGGGGGQSVLLGSRYLRVAQELLDEAVNVERATNRADSGAPEKKAKTAASGSGEELSGGGKRGGGKGVVAAELTPSLRQELQVKKAKLLNMLDEVEQRYRLYHNQMQAVSSSFEQAAGPGSATSYTALALRRISKQFRSLRDAIAAQVKASGRSLGEDDAGRGEGPVSRFRLFDQQLRRQRELQQLGKAQHGAWKPQRGLPERAVSVLRAWLFEHFLCPYPKDTDKHMLAKQTGLARSQVSNWFINARVRLWKPMVEEMYLQEVKADQEQNSSNDHPINTANNNTQNDNNTERKKNPTLTLQSSSTALHSHQQPGPPSRANHNNRAPPPPTAGTTTLHSGAVMQGFSFIGSTQMDPPTTQWSPKRQRRSDVHNLPCSILSMEMETKPGLGAYGVGEIGSRFDPEQQPGQLTLGLAPCENLSLSGTQQHNFMVSGSYDGIDIETQKRLAAQHFPDFVA